MLWISITNAEGGLLYKKLPKEGRQLEYGPETAQGTPSTANWGRYNYDRVWIKVGWHPWMWLMGRGEVKITANVVSFLFSQLRKVQQLPDQARDRLASKRPSTGGLDDATPENASGLIVWMLVWALEPGAAFITTEAH